jgi:spermidine synthase / saccharopine dehydrogenase (NADP+, L-glutamate-forming)
MIFTACRTLASSKALAADLPNATPISLDVTSPADLDAQIASHDLVISLIPYTFHAAVIKSAIKGKTHVVTTSYVSPAMRELDQQTKDAGIVVLNEIGLDPGIDHLYAIKTIDEVHAKGGKVRSLLKYQLHSIDTYTEHRSSSSFPTAVVFPLQNAPTILSVTNSPGLLAGFS